MLPKAHLRIAILAILFVLAVALPHASAAENIYPRLDLFRYATVEINYQPNFAAIRPGPNDSIYIVAQASAGFRFDGRLVGGPLENGGHVGNQKAVVAAYRSNGDLIFAEFRSHNEPPAYIEVFSAEDARVDQQGNLFVLGGATADFLSQHCRAFLVSPTGALVWTKAGIGSPTGYAFLEPPSSFLTYGYTYFHRIFSTNTLSRWSPSGENTLHGYYPLPRGDWRSPTSLDTAGSFERTFSGFPETFASRGGTDILIARYDNQQLKWTRQIGGPDYDYLIHVRSAQDASYVLYYAGGTPRMAKFSPDGDLLWDRQTEFRNPRSSVISPDGGIIIGGQGLLLQKYDRDGHLVWDYKTASDPYDAFDRLDIDSSGRLLAGGRMKGPGRIGTQQIAAPTAQLIFVSRFTLNNLPEPPTVTLTPERRTIRQGNPLRIDALASGLGPFQFQWQRNGVVLPNQTSATLLLPNLPIDAGGEYSVIVTSPYGAISAATSVEVIPQLYLTRAPVSKTVSYGTFVQFTAELTFANATSIQWLFNDQPIEGANAAFIRVTASLETVGKYTFTASSQGQTIQASALLDLSQPYLTPSLQDVVHVTHSGAILDASLSNDGSLRSIFNISQSRYMLRSRSFGGAVNFETSADLNPLGVELPQFSSDDCLFAIHPLDFYPFGSIAGTPLQTAESRPIFIGALDNRGALLWYKGLPNGSRVVRVTENQHTLVRRPDSLINVRQDGSVTWTKNLPTAAADEFFIASNQSGSVALDIPPIVGNSTRVVKIEPNGSVAWARSISPSTESSFSYGTVVENQGDRGALVGVGHSTALSIDSLNVQPYDAFSDYAYSLVKFSECGSAQWAGPLRRNALTISDRAGGFLAIGSVGVSQPISYRHVDLFPAANNERFYILHLDAAGELRAASLIPVSGLYLRSAALSHSGDLFLAFRGVGGNSPPPVTVAGTSYAPFDSSRDVILIRYSVDAPPSPSAPPTRKFGQPGAFLSIGVPVASSGRALAFSWSRNGEALRFTAPQINIPSFSETDAGEYRVTLRHAAGAQTFPVATLLWPKLEATSVNGELILRWDITDDSVTIHRAPTPDAPFEPITVTPRLNAVLNKMEATIPSPLRNGYFRFSAL